MPITFWKTASGPYDPARTADSERTGDMRADRDRYVADGNRVAEELARADEVLAVWLSGPFDYPRIAPESDLHMAVLVRPGSGRYYHHRLPGAGGTGRRLEIAFFPIDYFSSLLEKGCGSWGDVYDGHKLSDMMILFERGNVLSGIRERLDTLRPSRMLVGAEIESLRAGQAEVERLRASGRNADCLLRARRLATSALRLLLFAGKGRLFSKPSHLHTLLAGTGEEAQLSAYEMIQGVDGMSAEGAGGIVKSCSDLVRELYERRGVCAVD